MNFNIEDYKQYMTVDFYSINQYPGWTALGPVSESYYNTVYNNGQANSVECQKSKMLIGLRDESPAYKLNQELSGVRDSLSEKDKQVRKLQEALKDKDYAIHSLGDSKIRTQEQLEEVSATVNPLRDQLRKMEADLGKVRRAIGDLQFNNIVCDKK